MRVCTERERERERESKHRQLEKTTGDNHPKILDMSLERRLCTVTTRITRKDRRMASHLISVSYTHLRAHETDQYL
eukprot:205902-Amorphochlora_amoeboformis.AAC.1